MKPGNELTIFEHLDELRRRLVRRRTDSPDAIRGRLAAARRELACAQWYDYAIVNERIARAVEELKTIIEAERLRVQTTTRK